jgi:hypothetical protein
MKSAHAEQAAAHAVAVPTRPQPEKRKCPPVCPMHATPPPLPAPCSNPPLAPASSRWVASRLPRQSQVCRSSPRPSYGLRHGARSSRLLRRLSDSTCAHYWPQVLKVQGHALVSIYARIQARRNLADCPHCQWGQSAGNNRSASAPIGPSPPPPRPRPPVALPIACMERVTTEVTAHEVRAHGPGAVVSLCIFIACSHQGCSPGCTPVGPRSLAACLPDDLLPALCRGVQQALLRKDQLGSHAADLLHYLPLPARGGAPPAQIGHTLGLLHDGKGSLEYYSGQGVWAPIMGVRGRHAVALLSQNSGLQQQGYACTAPICKAGLSRFRCRYRTPRSLPRPSPALARPLLRADPINFTRVKFTDVAHQPHLPSERRPWGGEQPPGTARLAGVEC